MKHGSLFSGIGGFDLAAEWMGWENVFHCEWNEFGQKVLKYYWPEAISYADITKTDFSIHRGTIDILTGGFPCQPYSLAGKRKGKEDERHLWPEMLRAIREIQPGWVVGENVRGLINWNGGLVFHEVQAHLEAEGYEVFPFLLPAAGVNAPHERYRVWFVAHACSNGYESGGFGENRSTQSQGQSEGNKRERFRDDCRGIGEQGAFADTEDFRCRHGANIGCECRWEGDEDEQSRDDEVRSKHIGFSSCRDVTNPNSNGLERGLQKGIVSEQGRYRQKQPFTQYRTSSERRIYSFEGFPTQSPVCNGDDGLSARLDGTTLSNWRKESIKAGGNAIVPQEAHQIFKAIEQYNALAIATNTGPVANARVV